MAEVGSGRRLESKAASEQSASAAAPAREAGAAGWVYRVWAWIWEQEGCGLWAGRGRCYGLANLTVARRSGSAGGGGVGSGGQGSSCGLRVASWGWGMDTHGLGEWQARSEGGHGPGLASMQQAGWGALRASGARLSHLPAERSRGP